MKKLLVIIILIGAIHAVLDNFGFFKEDPAQVATETAQQLSESLTNTSNEDEVISLFRRKSHRYIDDAKNILEKTESSLQASNYTTQEKFANDINKIQVLQSKLNVTLNKFGEVTLSNEKARQDISQTFETELALTNAITDAINAKTTGGIWATPFAKAQILLKDLNFIKQTDELADSSADKQAAHKNIQFFREQLIEVRNTAEEIVKAEQAQIDSPETVSPYDLQAIQLLRNFVEHKMDKIDATDFQYDVVRQKFIEAYELEAAMTDNLIWALELKSAGEDEQAALTETKNLIERYNDVIAELQQMKVDAEAGKNPAEQPILVDNQPTTTPAQTEAPATPAAPAAPATLEEILPDEDKADVKAYLERKQPLLAAEFGREVCGLSTPLVSNEPTENMEKYIGLMASGVDYSAPTKPGLARAVAACNNYFGAEALIANYYYNLKKEKHSDGLLDNVANVVEKASMIGDAGKVEEFYSEQRKAESEIKRLAAWSGAELFGSLTEAKIKLTGAGLKNMLFK